MSFTLTSQPSILSTVYDPMYWDFIDSNYGGFNYKYKMDVYSGYTYLGSSKLATYKMYPLPAGNCIFDPSNIFSSLLSYDLFTSYSGFTPCPNSISHGYITISAQTSNATGETITTDLGTGSTRWFCNAALPFHRIGSRIKLPEGNSNNDISISNTPSIVSSINLNEGYPMYLIRQDFGLNSNLYNEVTKMKIHVNETNGNTRDYYIPVNTGWTGTSYVASGDSIILNAIGVGPNDLNNYSQSIFEPYNYGPFDKSVYDVITNKLFDQFFPVQPNCVDFKNINFLLPQYNIIYVFSGKFLRPSSASTQESQTSITFNLCNF